MQLNFFVKEDSGMFNKAELARRYNCDPRTIDRYIKIHTGQLQPVPTTREYTEYSVLRVPLIRDRIPSVAQSVPLTY